jgi:hypothetical protein
LTPPFETLIIANEPGKGNMHFVQKVFEGAFEVSMKLTGLRKDQAK